MAAPKVVAPPNIPEIKTGTDIGRMVDESIVAISDDRCIYKRGGKLVKVVTIPDGPDGVETRAKIGRASGSHVIREASHATIRERLATMARWIKWNASSKSYVGTLPPEMVVSALIDRGEWGGIRTLVSIATSPRLKPDGTILQTPGYDPSTGILYWPNEPYIDVLDEPTLDDAKGAIEALKEVVCDFPFQKPEHLSAWLAFLLTIFARPAIDGPVPLFAVDATTRGSGKSQLVDAACAIAVGRDAARTSLPQEDDEMRKRITSLVLEGDPIVLLDNITQPIVLPSLDGLITSTEWKDRELGRNATVTAPHRGVWCATGNNLILGGDLPRRTLHIRMESPLENPEDRTDFRHHPLLPWIKSQRRRLVASALTVLRAWTFAGSPRVTRTLESFTSWGNIIPQALVWAGEVSPLLARAELSQHVDEDKQILRVLHDGLARLQSDRWLTVRDILSALYPDRHPGEPTPPDGFDDLRDAIEEATRTASGRTPEAKRVGKLLLKWRGRVVGERRIVNGEPRKHVATWRVA